MQKLQCYYIYIYAFSRRFYPKRLTLHSSYSFTFYQLLLSLGIEPMILALLAPCSTIWATGKLITLLRCYYILHYCRLRIHYDGLRLLCSSFRLWYHPIWEYQTCLIFWATFTTYILLQSVQGTLAMPTHPRPACLTEPTNAGSYAYMFVFIWHILAMRHMFLWEFVVFGMIWNDLCMIFSCLVYDAQFFLYNHLQVRKLYVWCLVF